MLFPPDILRSASILVGLLASLATAPAARAIELAVTPNGSTASGRPLPAGATPNFTVTVRNPQSNPSGAVELTVRLDGLAAPKNGGWRFQDGALRTSLQPLAAGASVERPLRLHVQSAPIDPARVRFSVEAKTAEGEVAKRDVDMQIADCAGAYRARLGILRPTLSNPVREAADTMRQGDATLPVRRQFPPTGARGGELARAERLAAVFSARRGADPQMSTEWFRYMIARWASELNAFTGQTDNPGLCAGLSYQIAGYRQGLLPITKHIDTTHALAEASLQAARKEAAMETASLTEIARALAKQAELGNADEDAGPLALIASTRDGLGAKRPETDLSRKLSIAETAAWLAAADARGQAVIAAIDDVLASISKAHRESCVCAF